MCGGSVPDTPTLNSARAECRNAFDAHFLDACTAGDVLITFEKNPHGVFFHAARYDDFDGHSERRVLPEGVVT